MPYFLSSTLASIRTCVEGALLLLRASEQAQESGIRRLWWMYGRSRSRAGTVNPMT